MKKSFYLVGLAAITLTASAYAQGNPTGTSSDVTGPPTTSSAIAGGFSPSPGTTPTLATPEIQAAVANAGAVVTQTLSAGTLTTPSGVAIAPAAQAQVLAVLTSNSPTTGAAAQLSETLGAAGAPSAAVQALAASLSGLATNPAQLPTAIGDFNAVVEGASPAFLANPPAQFLAVLAVLTQMTNAAAASTH